MTITIAQPIGSIMFGIIAIKLLKEQSGWKYYVKGVSWIIYFIIAAHLLLLK